MLAGGAIAEVVTDRPDLAGRDRGRPLLQPLVRAGAVVGRESLAAARARHQDAVAELPSHARQLSRGYPAIPTVSEPDGD